jgi:flagellar protein FliO/FliZ
MRLAGALTLSLALAAGAAGAAEPESGPGTVAGEAAAAATPAPNPAPVTSPAAPAAKAVPAPATPVTTSPSSAGSLMQVIFGLLVVLGLLAGALWLLKRLGGGRLAGGSVVKIVGGVSVGNRERVMVVEVADQWIVIGVAPGQVSTLASMPRQEQQPGGGNATPGAPNFSVWLKQTIEKRNAN